MTMWTGPTLMDDMTSPYCAMYDGLSDDAKAIVNTRFMRTTP